LIGDFTWCWGNSFFIETHEGNFVWKDPAYNGDNSIVSYDGSLEDFLKENNLEYGRDKGTHIIGDYIGDEK